MAQGSHVVNNYTLIVKYMKDVSDVLRAWELPNESNKLSKAKMMFEIPLPGVGSVKRVTGRYNESMAYFDFASFTNPGCFFGLDFAEKGLQPKKLWQTKVDGYNPDLFQTDRVFYNSKDGTRIPLFLIRKKSVLPSVDSTPEKPIPTLIYTYGGFGVP